MHRALFRRKLDGLQSSPTSFLPATNTGGENFTVPWFFLLLLQFAKTHSSSSSSSDARLFLFSLSLGKRQNSLSPSYPSFASLLPASSSARPPPCSGKADNQSTARLAIAPSSLASDGDEARAAAADDVDARPDRRRCGGGGGGEQTQDTRSLHQRRREGGRAWHRRRHTMQRLRFSAKLILERFRCRGS